MDLGLAGRIAIVAGGARGCGRAIAEELAREGAKVAITGRTPEIVEAAVAEMRAEGLEALALSGNMEDREQVAAWGRTVRAAWGSPGVLVINPPGPDQRSRGFETTTDAQFLDGTNPWVMPLVYFGREFLPAMKAANWGRIVNIASEAIKVPHLTDPMYASNLRVATAAFMKTLSHEYGRFNVTCNTIATGTFMTPLTQSYLEDAGAYDAAALVAKSAMQRWGRPEEMGAVVAFLCSSRASYLTGEVIRVDGGYGHSLF